MVVQPLFVAGYLFLGQFGFISGASSWLGFVLLFGECDINLGFSFCANKTKVELLYVAISKVIVELGLVLQDY